jgi:hypothetical protein
VPVPITKSEVKQMGVKGPSPKCLCGNCPVCKNRKRQQRFQERNRAKLLQGINVNLKLEDEETEEELG